MVDIILIGLDPSPRCDELLDQRLDRGLFDILQHSDHHRATALDHPEDRGVSFFRVPRPRAPFKRRRRPRRLFFDGFRMSFMTRHHVYLVAFHLTRQARFRLAGDDPCAQLLGHPLHVVRIQAQFLGNLGIR